MSQRGLVKIKEVDTFKDSRLAQINDGKILIKKLITKDDLIKHITDSKGDEIGRQKSEVTKIMKEKYNIDLCAIIKNMSNKEAKRFVIEHEKAHFIQDETLKKKGSSLKHEYFRNKEAKEKYLTDEAILFEVQANLIALEKISKQLKLY